MFFCFIPLIGLAKLEDFLAGREDVELGERIAEDEQVSAATFWAEDPVDF